TSGLVISSFDVIVPEISIPSAIPTALLSTSSSTWHQRLGHPGIHPLRKECYELPPFLLRFDKRMHRESCGHGFDTSTNTWKMVYVLLKEYAPPDKPDMVKKNLCTNSWREIPQVPSYPISGFTT
nr:hypothetical protein [Tanacetum cinerariifolium]